MLLQEEDVEIHALRNRCRAVSEIARCAGTDRNTIRRIWLARQSGISHG